MKNGRLQIRVMILRQNYLLLGISAAYGGTITVAPLDHLPGTDTLDPGDLMRMFLVGRTQYLSFKRTGGT